MMNHFLNFITRKSQSNSGFSLVVVMGIFASAFVGFFALASVGSNHLRWQSDQSYSVKAFYLAEAAVEHAKDQLRADFDTLPVNGDGTTFTLGGGEYEFTVVATANPIQRLVTGTGAYPDMANPDATHVIEVVVEDIPPATLPDIFGGALWASGDLDINGNDRIVDGDIFAGNNINCNPGTCAGVNDPDPIQNNDPSYPFYYFSLEELESLKAMSQAQGNYFAGSPSSSDLPTSFYYQAPDPSDPDDKGIPNIVFIENDGLDQGALTLGGNTTVGGFYVVVGDYMANQAGGGGTVSVLNGTASLDGVIYVMGDFTKNGGGNNTTVDGAVFAQHIELNGKSQFSYNAEYVESIENAAIDSGALESVSWNQTD